MNTYVPLIPALRPPLYIETGAHGALFLQASFSLIQSDHTSAKGMCKFHCVKTRKESACGVTYPYLFSIQDYEWFQAIVSRYGYDIKGLVESARSGVSDVAYLFAWIESLRPRIGGRGMIFESETQPFLLQRVSMEVFLRSFHSPLFEAKAVH